MRFHFTDDPPSLHSSGCTSAVATDGPHRGQVEPSTGQLPEENDVPYFLLWDNCDDRFDDPAEWTYTGLRVAGRWSTLEAALRAATERALQLAHDPSPEVYSVEVVMHLKASGGMTVASIPIWNDHDPELQCLTALRTHLEADQHPA